LSYSFIKLRKVLAENQRRILWNQCWSRFAVDWYY
jgi:hypothetical protein